MIFYRSTPYPRILRLWRPPQHCGINSLFVQPSFPIPPPNRAQVWIDFDGTITQRDVLDDLIIRYAVDVSWKDVEGQWQAGQIGSRRCLELEFALIRITDPQLDAFLDEIRIDPGLGDLLDLLRRHGVGRCVLSDGIERFITRTLARNGITDLPIRSNRIERIGERMSLVCPLSNPDCKMAAAHCKCMSMRQVGNANRESIYIGDGRSDLCPARQCEVVFAKGALAMALAGEGKVFIPFDTLHDVTRVLREAWGET